MRAIPTHATAVVLLGIVPILAFAAGSPHSRTSAAADVDPSPIERVGEPLEFARVTLPNGVALHYAVQGDPAGPAVILLHGYSDSWYSFSGLLPLLPEGWRVYALSQRGHGESDQPVGDYSMRTLASDVVAFMDALGIARAAIVGHSMGSYVAQQVALLAPYRLDRLVIMGGTTTPRTVNAMDEFAAAILALEDPVPAEFVRAFQEGTVYAPVPAEFMDRAIAESSRLPARVWKGLMEGMLATGPADGLGAVGIPVLVLWGSRETIMPYEEQLALVKSLRARLVVYPETGHGLHWERPGEVGRDLIAFIDS